MLEFERVTIFRASHTVLKDISMTLPQNTTTVLLGKNGSGKSSLLSTLIGECPYTGTVSLGGTPLGDLSSKDRAQRAALLPQSLRAPHMTAKELVSLGRRPYLGLFDRLTEEDLFVLTSSLAQIGIEALSETYLDEMSGGERQKAYLAMVLAQNTPLLLLDEPTTYMDLDAAYRFMEILKELKEAHKKTLLIAMHDINLAIRYADRIALLDEGHLTFFGTVQDCLDREMIERTFSVRRIESRNEIFFTGSSPYKNTQEKEHQK